MSLRRLIACCFLSSSIFLVSGTVAWSQSRLEGGGSVSPAPLPQMMQEGDGFRPVVKIGPDSFTIQWFTATPQPTRVQIRTGGMPMTAWRPKGQAPYRPWEQGARIIGSESGKRTYHRLTIDGLEPGTRYFYRVFDKDAQPTSEQANQGAAPPWRREFGVITQADSGELTIVRLPVKVLLMPNVVDIDSLPEGEPPPLPPAMSEAEIEQIKAEYAVAARFYFVNSGCRLWLDWHFVVDPRQQRWGEPTDAMPDEFTQLPVCRSYPNEPYRSPGGGFHTFVDMDDPEATHREPIYEEQPFPGQIEQAFLWQWNKDSRQWTLRDSGGGTYGVADYWRGFIGRSQYLGGGDTAWLAGHEVGHQLESIGRWSFPQREDDRVTFNHPGPRMRRVVERDGKETLHATAWSTSGRHGQHWDAIAHHYRAMSPLQYLRFYFGEPFVTADADGDGIPDDAPELPLDESRFGSSADAVATDGQMNDLDKLLLSTFAPSPLQSSRRKPEPQFSPLDPRNPDQDDDGLADVEDPLPLIPYPPFIWPVTATLDGAGEEWKHLPPAMARKTDQTRIEYRHAHDDDFYYGMVLVEGAWRDIELNLDGGGKGFYSYSDLTPQPEGGSGQYHFSRNGEEVTFRAGSGGAGVEHKAQVTRRGNSELTTIEFRIPNGNRIETRQSILFWEGAGREVGVTIHFATPDGKTRSVFEPYRLVYYRMLPRAGG